MSNNETLLNNRYRLVAQQGSGGMAVIYRALDQVLDRVVAIKILRPSLSTDQAFLVRFRNEARAVAALNHPNIVTVHDVGNDGQTQYIVMEYVEGQDLKKIIKAEGVMTVERALKLAIQICAGIGFAHRAGLVHADVKPQNILVAKADVVKVTDFGIAQALSDTTGPGERASVVWGSPHYFAPEQARGERPTPSSDVYSIGIVMFEMLTGRLPYVGTNQQELAMAHIRERVPLVTEFNPNVPEALAQVIYKVMSKEPAARYRIADQLGHVLAEYRDRGRAGTIGVSQPPQPSAPLPGQPAAQPPRQPSVVPQPPIPFSQQQPAAPQQQLPFSQAQPPVQPPQTPNPLPFTQTMPPAGQGSRPYTVVPDSQSYRPGPPSPFDQPVDASAQGSRPVQTWSGGTSQPMYSQPMRPLDEAPPSLDLVTIALAILAFLAVACLIPLYIAVFQARFGG
jgi:serine/threonine-protein kinase